MGRDVLYVMNNLRELVPSESIMCIGASANDLIVNVFDSNHVRVGNFTVSDKPYMILGDTLVRYPDYYPDVIAECINEVVLKPECGVRYHCIGSRRYRGMTLYTLKYEGGQKELYGTTLKFMLDKFGDCIDNVYDVVGKNVRYVA